MKKVLLLKIFLFVSLNINAQYRIDTINKLSFDELIMVYNNEPFFEKKEFYVKSLINKAKKENNTSYLISGYHIAAVLYNDLRMLKYSDSLISITKNSPDKFYPGTGYLIKGNYYYEKRDFQNALDNYLMANRFAKKYFNEEFIFKSNHSIGILKERIGESYESLKLHRENFSYSRKNIASISKSDYLISIFALSNTFNNLMALDSASFYNKYGIKQALRLNNEKAKNLFTLNEGVTLFHKKKYLVSVDSVKKSILFFKNVDDKPNLAVGYFYLGKSYYKLKKKEEAINYLKKVDTIFKQTKDILPKLRETYVLLIKHFKEENKPEQQLKYIEQLIKLDSILYNNEIYLNKYIVKEYDLPKLISEKEGIIHSLTNRNKQKLSIISALSIAFLVLLIAFYYQHYKRKLYKKKFEDIIKDNERGKNISNKVDRIKNSKNDINISQNIIDDILKNLVSFEENNDFLDSSLTLQVLAKKIDSNSNYLSKVINHFKGMSFSNYINLLRVEYSIDQLRNNSTFRKYTINAIAKEVGFNNSESFSKAFNKNTGIKPSYFIKELEKINN